MGQEYTQTFKATIKRETNKSSYGDTFDDPIEAARALLVLLTDEQRIEVFGDYCRDCGRYDRDLHLGCQCENDD